jgi:hypothetical protein
MLGGPAFEALVLVGDSAGSYTVRITRLQPAVESKKMKRTSKKANAEKRLKAEG